MKIQDCVNVKKGISNAEGNLIKNELKNSKNL